MPMHIKIWSEKYPGYNCPITPNSSARQVVRTAFPTLFTIK